MIIASELKNFPFIVKISSNEKETKKQHKAFSIDTHVGTGVDLAAMFSFSVSAFNTTVSKRSEIEKSYSHCEPSFSKNANL
jgi:hypothetical protein